MKRFCVCFLALFFILFTGFSVLEAEVKRPHRLTVREKWSDFQQLVNQVKSQYGPKIFKKRHLGIDVDELAQKYWTKMRRTRNNGDFYSLIVRFVAEFKDGHFKARIPTKFKAYLPFDVNLVQDRVLIEHVDREKLPETRFPFDRGDEVISMGGRPVRNLIDELVPYVSSGNPRAAIGMATYMLTYRSGSIVPVPFGYVDVTLRSRDGMITQTIKLQWQHEGNSFDENLMRPGRAMKMMSLPSSVKASYHDDYESFDPTNLSTFDIIEELRQGAEYDYHCSGKTRISIPDDATILMEEPFTAYYHPTEKGNVGYLRIPHYYPEDEDNDGEKDFDEWLEYYRWALTNLQENTVGLIIDQDHNCGGSVMFLEDVVSLFMTREFDPLAFRWRASKREILEWKSWMKSFERPYYMLHEGFLEVMDLLEYSFSRGLYLTPKSSIHGTQRLSPRGVYTKPIIMLVDYFAGSGGDAFPGLMQGYGRAKLLGSTTWGLGGHVEWMEPLFYSQIRYRMTQSLFFRPDGVPVENNGVTPDIPYEITVNDFVGGYKGYQSFYLSELLKMIE